MRVLSVAGRVPYPPNHPIRVRNWHLLARLAARHEVVLATWRLDEPDDVIERVRNVVAGLEVGTAHEVDVGIAARLRRQLRFLRGAPPPFVQEMLEARDLDTAEGRRRWLASLEGYGRFDVVVAEEESMRFAPLVELEVPVVVHRLNVFGRVIADERRRRPVDRVRWLAEAAAWRRFDREAMAGTVLALATTPESAEALRSIECHPPIEVVTNGVEVRPLRTPPYGSRDIAFVGWMGYEPNVQAVCWFVRTVWPEVRRAYPESRFRIVGRNPSPRVRALEGDGVVVTGEVPDVADACEGVRLGVVPLRAGMGVKNKTLELLAMGLPVVGTPVAAEGLSPGGEDGLIVAEDQRAMRDAVLRLMADDEDVKRLGAEARAFVERRFAWDAIGDRYVRSLERAASGGEV